MPAKKSNSSTQQARELRDGLLREARRLAKNGEDIRPGTEQFWGLVMPHFVKVSDLLNTIHREAVEEQKARIKTSGEVRPCVACGGDVVKKHVRGRWPIYCEMCRLSDRED